MKGSNTKSQSSINSTETSFSGFSEGFNWEMTEVLDNINIGFFSKDILSKQYINLTKGCPQIYGYTLEDFLNNGQLWYEVILPEDRTIVENETAALEKGEKCQSEYRIYHRDGSIRWLEVKVLPVLKDGILVRVDGIVSDITERKKSEFEIVKAQKLSEIVINSLPGIFYLYNDKGQFLLWNQNFETVTGYSPEEIREISPLVLFEGEDKNVLQKAINSVFENGFADVESRLLTKDGRQIPYYFNGRNVNIEGENCLVGMGIDITERKKAEEALQKNEEMLSHILNTIPQAIFWKDTSCRYTGCNEVFAKVVGLGSNKEVIGTTDFDFPWEEGEAAKYQKDDLEVMETKVPKIKYVETISQANGELTWLETTKIPLKDTDNQVYGVLGIFEDITERKLEEEKQKKINADLIQKNIGLRQFSYIISHYLRSPICRILGLASLFENAENRNSLNQELVQHIVNEVSNLDGIVKDLNTIVACQDLGNKLIEEVFLYDELALIKEQLNQELTNSKALIIADFKIEKTRSVRSYLNSILYNIVSNAIKYRDPERSLIITMESKAIDGFMCLSVQDNGLGLDTKKYGNKIFGLYNRFHTTLSPGKGIGLNLVKTQAETLGGKVELDSEPGKGCTIKVYLPLG